ncbi:NUDIX hydrolase [Neptunitalea lumnitzerae]|uniref:Nudix hydrolase domain-containing protein n=1 Tax=Neptunitalea lumnitzerae TaxID=2965509 RepID=A0ABQ5MLX8_9FLAO|nr:NUDIX domain-containing protein [Neptunitalea sp. Y10]GLB50075.1 hypothetical protein Y10_24430 [Neptunitalea sp. Y10]
MKEYVDILDAHGEKTGTTCTRDQAHRYGYLHATVHIWFYTRNHEILFQKRSTKKETFPGLWDISVAGHVSAGETIIEAAIKEIHEEIGVSVKATDLYNIGIEEKLVKHSNEFIDAEFNHVFICELTVPFSQLSRQKEEVDELKLTSIKEFESILNNNSYLTSFVPRQKSYYQNILNLLYETLDR